MFYEIKVHEHTPSRESIYSLEAQKIVFNKNGGIDIFLCNSEDIECPVFPCPEKNVTEITIKIFRNEMEQTGS